MISTPHPPGTLLAVIRPGFSRSRLVWGSMLSATVLVAATALSTPLLSPTGRAAVMHLFAPVCHQIPLRSPHVGGVVLAVCDRCIGIYLGLVAGVATVGGARPLWRRLGRYDRYLLLASLVPLGINWAGPVLGLWTNGPVGRALTGLLFGGVAASFVADRLLRWATRQHEAPASTRDGETGFA